MNVVVKIRGGLGNQLFQYAFAKKIALECNAQKVILDITYFNKTQIRGIDIDKYQLPSNVYILNKPINRLFDLLYFTYRITDKMHYKLKKRHRNSTKLLSKLGFYFCDISCKEITINRKLKNIYLAGYFQDEKQIREICKNINTDLVLKSYLSEKFKQYNNRIIESKESIGVSIRIGDDYKKFGWPICKKEFYENGVNIINKKKGIKNVFVFSDCIDLIEREQWLSQYNTVYIKGCNAVESLDLLKKCTNFVIANSTFSWWGAYLSETNEKIIIAPEFFYKNIKMKDTEIATKDMLYLNNENGKMIEEIL